MNILSGSAKTCFSHRSEKDGVLRRTISSKCLFLIIKLNNMFKCVNYQTNGSLYFDSFFSNYTLTTSYVSDQIEFNYGFILYGSAKVVRYICHSTGRLYMETSEVMLSLCNDKASLQYRIRLATTPSSYKNSFQPYF